MDNDTSNDTGTQPTQQRMVDRTPSERQRDMGLIIKWKTEESLNDFELTDRLNARPDVHYKLKRRTVTNDKNQALREWEEKNLSTTPKVEEVIAEQLAEIERVRKAAWEGYLQTLKPSHTREFRKMTQDGEIGGKLYQDFIEKEVRHVRNTPNPSHHLLQVILRCLDQAARLQSIYRLKVEIDKREQIEHTHHIKMYQVVSPEDWDNEPELLEGEYESI